MLRSLPDIFNPKVSAIKEIKNLNSLTLDQLLGTLTACGMRISNGNPTTRESTFKVEKKPKGEHSGSCCETNKEGAKFLINIKRGSRKYKGKLPFKFFTVAN